MFRPTVSTLPGLIHLLILRFIAYVIINHVEESMPRGMCCERKGLQTARSPRWEEILGYSKSKGGKSHKNTAQKSTSKGLQNWPIRIRATAGISTNHVYQNLTNRQAIWVTNHVPYMEITSGWHIKSMHNELRVPEFVARNVGGLFKNIWDKVR